MGPDPITPHPITPSPVPEPIRQCGRRNTGGIGVRIQNNDEYSATTQFGEWPHMCAILKKGFLGGKEVNFYVGGASLIHPGIALTAAHIVYDFVNEPQNLKVRCGEWDTRQVIEPYKHETGMLPQCRSIRPTTKETFRTILLFSTSSLNLSSRITSTPSACPTSTLHSTLRVVSPPDGARTSLARAATTRRSSSRSH